VAASGYDPVMFGVQLRGAHDLQAIDDDTFARYNAIDDPAQIKAIVDGLRTQAPAKLEKIETTGPGGEAVTQFVTPTAGATYPVAPSKPTPLSYQAKDVL